MINVNEKLSINLYFFGLVIVDVRYEYVRL